MRPLGIAGIVPLALTLALALAPRPAAAQWARVAPGLSLLQQSRVVAGLPRVVSALRVDLCHPAVELRVTTPAEQGRTVVQWARRVGAAAAINGDYFDPHTLRPLGPTRGAGVDWPTRPWELHEALFVAAPGGRAALLDTLTPAGALTPNAALAPPTWTELLAGRERVLVGGEPRDNPALSPRHERHPRTGLGLSRDGHTLVLVVIDGRSPLSAGATPRELGQVLRDLGAWEGIKLDGGGSSGMFVRGRGVVNRPSDGHPRAVATHLGVMVGTPRVDAPPRCSVDLAARPD